MGSLKGKNAFITGTSQGIGAASARALIDAGCNICLHYFHNSKEPLQMVRYAEEKGQKAIALQADLKDHLQLKSCIKEAAEYLNGLDVVVNNSGGLVQRRYLDELDDEYVDELINLNLKTMINVTKEVYPYLKKANGASIVNISSLAGRTGGHSGSLIYSTCKGAVITWSRTLAKELASDGIRVNNVAPGFIEGTRFHKEHTTKESALKTIDSIPLGRSGKPEDVAGAVVFLASEYDGFITGETIDINGGTYSA